MFTDNFCPTCRQPLTAGVVGQQNLCATCWDFIKQLLELDAHAMDKRFIDLKPIDRSFDVQFLLFVRAYGLRRLTMPFSDNQLVSSASRL